MMERTVDMLPLRIDIHPDDEIDGWIAGFPELDLYTQGPDVLKALANLREALHLWVSYCVEHNTLEQALEECGFSLVRIEKVKSTLPGFMAQAKRSESTCRA